MTRLILQSALAGLLWLAAAAASGQTINLRMSVKVIVHPSTGAWPPDITAQVFTNAVAAANEWMASYCRGYRYQLMEVQAIGGPSQGGTNGPSRWYDLEFRGDPLRRQFFNLATNDTRYLLRFDQINIYVASGFAKPGDSGGAMPIPPGETNYIGGQIYADDGAWWIVHELGHFFGLPHTFATQSQGSCAPGDDGFTDTLLDSTCWSNQNQVAQFHFGADYDALNNNQKDQVDTVFFNVMSYHDYTNKNTTENRLTEQQLDRLTDHANGDRHAFVGGYTRFVSPSGNDSNSGLDNSAPKRTVLNAVNASASGGGDIVLLRPGNYNERTNFNRRVTLRATRAGWATIGKP